MSCCTQIQDPKRENVLTRKHQSKTGPGNEKERFRVLIPFAQFLTHDKTTNQSDAAEELQTPHAPIRADAEAVGVETLSFEGTPFLASCPMATGPGNVAQNLVETPARS